MTFRFASPWAGLALLLLVFAVGWRLLRGRRWASLVFSRTQEWVSRRRGLLATR